MVGIVTKRPAAIGGDTGAILRRFSSPALVRAEQLFSTLLDAFVERLQPMLARFRSNTRWVAVVETGAMAVYEVRSGHPPVRVTDDAGEGTQARIQQTRTGVVELRLPPDQVLHRTLQLPPASKDFLQPIIEHRLERLTPWSPDKVLYGFQIVDAAAVDGAMTVAFAATSSDIVAESTRRLEAFGLVPTALGTAAEPIDSPLQIDLFRGERSASRLYLRRSTAIVLAVIAAVIAPACLGSFWLVHAQEQRLSEAADRLAQLRARLPTLTGAKAEQARGRDRALIETKRPETSLVVLIDMLSAALPSNTSLRELDIDGAKIRLVGRSRNAPALIGLLEQEEALAKVEFAAPVIRDSENLDDFEIVAARVVREARDGQR